VALAGNIQVALLGFEQSVFAWLEAIIPPLVVLSTAYVLKGQILEAIEQRHATEHAYQSALTDWRTLTTEPEQLPGWPQFYANALQDALRKANARRKETLVQMAIEDWRLAVGREMRADMWFQGAELDDGSSPFLSPAVEAITASSNGNGPRPKVSAAAV
jgi:hypothetical protein